MSCTDHFAFTRIDQTWPEYWKSLGTGEDSQGLNRHKSGSAYPQVADRRKLSRWGCYVIIHGLVLLCLTSLSTTFQFYQGGHQWLRWTQYNLWSSMCASYLWWIVGCIVFSTNNIDHHDITEIFLKVDFTSIIHPIESIKCNPVILTRFTVFEAHRTKTSIQNFCSYRSEYNWNTAH